MQCSAVQYLELAAVLALVGLLGMARPVPGLDLTIPEPEDRDGWSQDLQVTSFHRGFVFWLDTRQDC